ncbi:MAG: hypothetical protein ACOYUB_04895 [Patescibacteria group bacterium]
MKTLEVAVVIPTVRDMGFLKAWGNEFKDCIGIIIEDRPKKEISAPKKHFDKVFHYSWEDIDRELGNRSWIISRKNAGIRNFGFLKAYQLGADITVTLDDDCYPVKGQKFLETHLKNLSSSAPKDWFPTYPHRHHYPTRGFPYSVRNNKEVVISHGLWSDILDFDAKTHLKYPGLKSPVFNQDLLEFIPKDYFFPLCSMNLAFKTKMTPIMYFPPMGQDAEGKRWGYDRFDDIWAGILSKKIIDHMGFAVVNGSPYVRHKKASNVMENLKKEAKGIMTNENLYKSVKDIKLTGRDIKKTYLKMVRRAAFPKEKYFSKLKEAIRIWVSLFD